jgi:CDP-diacylglycerol--serine O-phosphatidyltransferase
MNSLDAIRRLEKLRDDRRVRKGMFVLPSLFTAGNIAAGYFAITEVMKCMASKEFYHLDYAAMAIGFAVFFDGLDGRIARATNTTSAFGKELDSLADCIAFGVAPALLAYAWGFHFLVASIDVMGDGQLEIIEKLQQVGGISTFLFLVAGACRLARFNITVNPQPSNPGRPDRKYFVGMAIPAGAGLLAAVIHLFHGIPITNWYWSVIWGILIFCTGYLMVCTWRYPSFKDLNVMRQRNFRGVILLTAIITGIYVASGPVLFALASVYTLSGIVMRIQYWLRRPSAKPDKKQSSTDVLS